MKNYRLVIFITIFLFGCSESGTTNYDGLWVIDKEKSLAECRKNMESDGEGELLQGFAELICQTVTGIIPVLDIVNDQFNISTADNEVQNCNIIPENNVVSCSAESENAEDLSDFGKIILKDGVLSLYLDNTSADEPDTILIYNKK